MDDNHHSFSYLKASQADQNIYCFSIEAKLLWSLVQINKRDSDKNIGYQRTLSMSRVNSITKFINTGNVIPNTILIALDNETEIDEEAKVLRIPNKPDAGWVIDGQHRAAGAQLAEKEIEYFVIALINISLADQISQFVTINREAKGVPTSLYMDLLKNLPSEKSEKELANQRSTDIALSSNKDEDSAFRNRIVVMTSPKRGELSLNNFNRKVSVLLKPGGKLYEYSYEEQYRILNNYFNAIETAYPSYFETFDSFLYTTTGFGALINAFSSVFDLTIKHYQAFAIADIVKLFEAIEDFPFEEWKDIGTGNQAEKMAGQDLVATLKFRLEQLADGLSGQLRLE